MLWDLIQQLQLGEARNQASSLEERVAYLERKVERNDRVLVELIRYLEKREGRDLDGDG
jgi:uncharacterized protein YigA (DUF484 family)